MSRNASEVAKAHASLKGYVRREVSSAADAEDIVQESWLRMVQVEHRGPVQNLGAYLRRIASNLIKDAHRHRALRIEVSLPAEMVEAVPSQQSGPEALLITRQELARMDKMLAKLPMRSRQVFYLARIEGLTFAEIGRQLGLSRQTVHGHMGRALMALQAAIEDGRGPT